jgi:hypothetical protein
MSKKRARKGLRPYVVARIPGGGKLKIAVSDNTVLIIGKVRPDRLALPAVQELIEELQTTVDRANGQRDQVGAAIARFRTGFRLAIASATENAPIADPPPKIAEFLLTALATTRAAEAMIGDLNERFATECKDLGRDRAVRFYWARTLRSLGPLLQRKALKWCAVIAIMRRLF